MNWLESLLWDPSSVAHIVCLYAFVISVGVLLGKIKIFGVSLGVTFVLFAGILMGHFGFTGETHILHFIREFGLILFVFCIGLQVGPSFFSSFKKGGMRLNMLAVGIVLLNIAVALSIYFIAVSYTHLMARDKPASYKGWKSDASRSLAKPSRMASSVNEDIQRRFTGQRAPAFCITQRCINSPSCPASPQFIIISACCMRFSIVWNWRS